MTRSQGTGPTLGASAFEPPVLPCPMLVRSGAPMFMPMCSVPTPGPDGEDVFSLERLAAISMLVTTAEGPEHLLICDGFHAIRLDVMSGTLAAGPAELRYQLDGLASADRPVLTLRRLLALSRTGQLNRSLHPREVRARRWIHASRIRCALRRRRPEGNRFHSAEPGSRRPRWRSRSPSLRSQVQRLVRGARRMASDGYVELLR